MYYKTEKEIISNWKSEISKPIISVCCITYNQEIYIEETLNSFLMQETIYPFEIVIGEDCSTDNTKNIVLEYQEKYPKIIKVITSSNNVGMSENAYRTLMQCKGEFIALCEGDDYWINKNKLQIQVDKMRVFPKVNMSFHSSLGILDDEPTITVGQHKDKNIFSTEELIIGGGSFCHTGSLMFRNSILAADRFWFTKDHFLQILGSLNGGAIYINEKMSVYRRCAVNSWTSTQQDVKCRLEWLYSGIESLESINKELNFEYDFYIKKNIEHSCWNFLMDHSISKKERIKFYKCTKKYIPYKKKLLWNFPKLRKFAYKIMKKNIV